MTTAEKTELGLIAAVGITTAVFHEALPAKLESGYFILSLGLLFLFQTLLRDIWLLIKQRKIARKEMPAAQCMCLESAIGFIPVIAAGLLFTTGISHPLALSTTIWIISILLVLVTGFGLKDYIFEWNPWRIRKDPDHVNFSFRLRCR